MGSKYPSVDLSQLKTISIESRKSKTNVNDFARVIEPGSSVKDLLESLPDILAGRILRVAIHRIVEAYKNSKPVVLAMGAHVIKCGLSPILCNLMRCHVITALAMNGAGAIHDSEIARFGHTSEDVVDGLRSGTFGMARETAEFLNNGARTAAQH